tara:strand:+ start:274 stop:786 length:513 start_codon:yes stop_codon:yes gene_type:complete
MKWFKKLLFCIILSFVLGFIITFIIYFSITGIDNFFHIFIPIFLAGFVIVTLFIYSKKNSWLNNGLKFFFVILIYISVFYFLGLAKIINNDIFLIFNPYVSLCWLITNSSCPKKYPQGLEGLECYSCLIISPFIVLLSAFIIGVIIGIIIKKLKDSRSQKNYLTIPQNKL